MLTTRDTLIDFLEIIKAVELDAIKELRLEKIKKMEDLDRESKLGSGTPLKPLLSDLDYF